MSGERSQPQMSRPRRDSARRTPRTRLAQAEPEHAEALAELQRVCFSNLGSHELMTAEHFLQHQELFPEGEFVVLAADAPDGRPLEREAVVGLGSGFLIDFDLQQPDHSFNDIIAGGSYANHDPGGDWYYGADISVHPDYRGLGLGRELYQARQGLVRRLKRLGIVAGGQLPGYPQHRHSLGVSDYVERVVAGELTDPTLSFQLANGFEVYGLLQGYIDDEHTDDWATFLVWFNPDLMFPATFPDEPEGL